MVGQADSWALPGVPPWAMDAPGDGDDDLLAAIDRALLTLDEDDRELLLDHYLGGRSQRELADGRGCPRSRSTSG